jgi:hypothetical protein
MIGTSFWRGHLSQVESSGVVTQCYREGKRVEIVFTCKNVGHGFLSLSFAPGEQGAQCTYIAWGPELIETKPTVRGCLTIQDGGATFDGEWYEYDDGEVHDFSIAISDCDLTVATPAPLPPSQLIGDGVLDVDAHIAKLDQSAYTNWLSTGTSPMRPGVYLLLPRKRKGGIAEAGYALWDGMHWYGSTDTLAALRVVDPGWMVLDDDELGEWCGVSERAFEQIRASLLETKRDYSRRLLPQMLEELKRTETNMLQAWGAARAAFRKVCADVDEGRVHKLADHVRMKLNDWTVANAHFAQQPELKNLDLEDQPPEQAYDRVKAALAKARRGIEEWTKYWEDPASAAAREDSDGVGRTTSTTDWERWKLHGVGAQLQGHYGGGKRR